MKAWITVVMVSALAATVLGGFRYWRIAQREHYIAGSATRFALRWWRAEPINAAGFLFATGSSVAESVFVPIGLVAVVLLALLPHGLSLLRGRTAPLVWTRRLWLCAGLSLSLWIGATGLGVVLGSWRTGALVGTIATLVFPPLVDISLGLLAPLEERFARRFVNMAIEKIRLVHPEIVAITGSYGKTSTKQYVEQLIGSRFVTVVSPRSFNNRAGLARAVNDHLDLGTEVFVAEMGTYREGEIAELCEWLPPTVAAITAIGPVHLERFKTIEGIVRAKAEIATKARFIALNKDDEALRALGEVISSQNKDKTVIWCSGSDRSAEVCVIDGGSTYEIFVRGRFIGVIDVSEFNSVAVTNLASAIGIAVALGVEESEIVARAGQLPLVANRLVPTRSPEGVVVIDDTFNANPSGTRRALVLLQRLAAPDSRRIVVTPGMVELGSEQRSSNEQFGAAAAKLATELIIVGRTNRKALLRGAKDQMIPVPPHMSVLNTREEAVAFVRSMARAGDVVLYENDLPDHYP